MQPLYNMENTYQPVLCRFFEHTTMSAYLPPANLNWLDFLLCCLFSHTSSPKGRSIFTAVLLWKGTQVC